jgi:ubiquinone/menaquinone biosynthesis C-methylase UbiE
MVGRPARDRLIYTPAKKAVAQMNDAAETAQRRADTFGRAAEFYDRSPYFPIAGQRLVELAEIPRGARVLDVACGTGAVLFPAAERVGNDGRVIGIDLAEAMVAKTSAEVKLRGIRQAEVRRMNAEALQFDDASFDRVTCGFALWFIPDLHRALSEMHRVLSPGGRIAVSTWGPPNTLTAEHNRLLAAYGVDSGALAKGMSSHTLTSSNAVQSVLKSAGFEIAYASEEQIEAVFVSEEEWWSQRMACPQLYTETLSPEDGQRFKGDVIQMLRSFRAEDGIHETRTAVFATAAKAE